MFPNQCLSTMLCLPVPMFSFLSPLESLGVIFTCLLTCSFFFTGLQIYVMYYLWYVFIHVRHSFFFSVIYPLKLALCSAQA